MKTATVIFIRFLFSLFLFFSCCDIYSQTQEHLFDSIMNLMRDKSIPLLERYYMTGDIEILDREYKIEVLKELIPEAKDFEDKAVITRLYSLISLFHSNSFQFENAKLYIDSAFQYVDEIDNIVIKGVAYHSAGTYYAVMDEIPQAHENFYKAAECFKMKDPKLDILNEIYYNLSTACIYNDNITGLKDLIEWQKEVYLVYPYQYILRSIVNARYFQAMYNRTSEITYLDSISLQNKQAFEILSLYGDLPDVSNVIAESFLSEAYIFLQKNQPDSIKYYLDKAIEYTNPNDIYLKLRTKYFLGHIQINENDFLTAEKTLLTGLKEMENLNKFQNVYYYGLLNDYYELLSQIQEKLGKTNDALVSGRESLRYQLLLYNKNSSEYVHDLRAKYDLDNKQRMVDQLTEINKSHQRNRILYIGVAILLAIIIMLIIFLSRRKRKMVQAKLHEMELTTELEKEKSLLLNTKIEENEKRYQLMLSERKLEQVNSYLAGLESERSRLSKELHDNVANNVLAIKMSILNSEKVEMSEVADKLDYIQEHVRTISHELIPPAFQYATFVEILNDYFNSQSKAGKVNFILFIDSPEEINEIPEKILLEIYRIIQECSGNIIKHASASKGELFLYRENNHLNLTITDNGKGFDINKRYKGIGLIIINERVKSLNGNLKINSIPGNGTEINVIIPVD